MLGFLVHFEVVCRVIRRWNWNVVGSGSGMLVAARSDGVGVGVVVLEGSVVVGVGLAMRFCVRGADAELAGRLSRVISIGVVVVSGLPN